MPFVCLLCSHLRIPFLGSAVVSTQLRWAIWVSNLCDVFSVLSELDHGDHLTYANGCCMLHERRCYFVHHSRSTFVLIKAQLNLLGLLLRLSVLGGLFIRVVLLLVLSVTLSLGLIGITANDLSNLALSTSNSGFAF